jgi:hypothetical protein
MAERAGATVTEIAGSDLVMISQAQAVRTFPSAAAAVGQASTVNVARMAESAVRKQLTSERSRWKYWSAMSPARSRLTNPSILCFMPRMSVRTLSAVAATNWRARTGD